jgi:hypothetical protein
MIKNKCRGALPKSPNIYINIFDKRIKNYYTKIYSIEIYCSDDNIIDSKLVLLHELAHAINRQKITTSFQKTKNGRIIRHDNTFWNIAFQLYKEYNILDYAIEHERYKKGKLYLINKNNQNN